MTNNRFWWPLELSAREEVAVKIYRERMQSFPQSIDSDTVSTASQRLAWQMQPHIQEIIDRDGLPHLCHILNGWGNARLHEQDVIQNVGLFTHRDPAGQPFILQSDPEGDFHPWQSFAYAIMAGVDPDQPIPSAGASLRTLAHHSRLINTNEGCELGHLLFALAHLEPNIQAAPFNLRGQVCDVATLMEKAVYDHHYGSFKVCRKFHLTEGLCAMAKHVPGLEPYRGVAQGFLDGQLDMLLVLGVIIQEASQFLAAEESPAPDSLLQDLRRSLVIGSYLENHFYYAGHLIELAAFAHLQGYSVAPEHWGAITFIVHELNALLPIFLPHVQFEECFLHFGHYRRAITLLLEIQSAQEEGQALKRADLQRYTIDFDRLAGQEQTGARTGQRLLDLGVYDLVKKPKKTRPAFEAAVALYAARARPGLEPRGTFEHFRRIGPPAWPRAFHYELLDYGGPIGVEIHIENENLADLGNRVRSMVERVAQQFSEQQVTWDPAWYRNSGRLCVIFREGSPASEVASGLNTLIEATFPELDEIATRLVFYPTASSDFSA